MNAVSAAPWPREYSRSLRRGLAIASSTDPAFVVAGAIPWLLLKVVGAEEGPISSQKQTATTYIQR